MWVDGGVCRMGVTCTHLGRSRGHGGSVDSRAESSSLGPSDTEINGFNFNGWKFALLAESAKPTPELWRE